MEEDGLGKLRGLQESCRKRRLSETRVAWHLAAGERDAMERLRSGVDLPRHPGCSLRILILSPLILPQCSLQRRAGRDFIEPQNLELALNLGSQSTGRKQKPNLI